MALTKTNKKVLSLGFDTDGANTITAVRVNIAFDIEDSGVVEAANIVRIVDIWPQLTAPQKTAFQGLYNKMIAIGATL